MKTALFSLVSIILTVSSVSRAEIQTSRHQTGVIISVETKGKGKSPFVAGDRCDFKVESQIDTNNKEFHYIGVALYSNEKLIYFPSVLSSQQLNNSNPTGQIHFNSSERDWILPRLLSSLDLKIAVDQNLENATIATVKVFDRDSRHNYSVTCEFLPIAITEEN